MNLAKMENLVSVAKSLGLPTDEAREILTTRQFREAVDDDWQRSRKLGVTGVPTFVVGEQGVVGAQPYEVLEQLVLDSGAVDRARKVLPETNRALGQGTGNNTFVH